MCMLIAIMSVSMILANPERNTRNGYHRKFLRNSRIRFPQMKRIRASDKNGAILINHFLKAFGNGMFPRDPTFGSYKHNAFAIPNMPNILAVGYPSTKYPASPPMGEYPISSRYHPNQQHSHHQDECKI